MILWTKSSNEQKSVNNKNLISGKEQLQEDSESLLGSSRAESTSART